MDGTEIRVAADPFPYFSGITLMEGLSMGHPVVAWANLRHDLRHSPMIDRAALAAKVAVAYRPMWQKWCRMFRNGEKQVQP